jgi:hypothetical protein
MFFYCTTKIKNYYKVGIASSLDRVKKRLTTYRSANPGVRIKFFSEIEGTGEDIEWSFKNKFDYFRIDKSECYRLDFDVIYKHFLKFQHKFNKLHHFWSVSTFYLSEYYLDKKIFDIDIPDFSEARLKDARFGFFPGFIPIAKVIRLGDKVDKENNMTIQAKILDINNVDLKEYRNKYNKHLKEKFYGQQYSYINQEFKKFFDDNFKIRKNFKAQRIVHVEGPIDGEIFKMFEKKYKSITKKYPKNPVGCAYWERPEQKYLGVKSHRLTKKIVDKFQGKHDIDYVMDAISSSIPRGNRTLFLETFLRIVTRFSIRAPREIREAFYKIEKEIESELKEINKSDQINIAIEMQIDKSKKRVKKRYLKVVK